MSSTKSTPLGRFIDEFGNHISTAGLAKIRAEHAALRGSNDVLKRAVAYLVLMGATEGKYWDEPTVKWARDLMIGEPRTGGQLVHDALKILTRLEAAQSGKRKKKGNA
jgi:hypothetical protein